VRRWRRPWQGNAGVQAALHHSRRAGEPGLFERHADLALMHHLVEAGMPLHPRCLRQDPCAQAESWVLMCGLGIIGSLASRPDERRIAALRPDRRDQSGKRRPLPPRRRCTAPTAEASPGFFAQRVRDGKIVTLFVIKNNDPKY
jgi:hypothetical protein